VIILQEESIDLDKGWRCGSYEPGGRRWSILAGAPAPGMVEMESKDAAAGDEDRMEYEEYVAVPSIIFSIMFADRGLWNTD
jgi:hypothetical protein